MKQTTQHPINASPRVLLPMSLALLTGGISLWVDHWALDLILLLVSIVSASVALTFAVKTRMWLVGVHAAALIALDLLLLVAAPA